MVTMHIKQSESTANSLHIKSIKMHEKITSSRHISNSFSGVQSRGGVRRAEPPHTFNNGRLISKTAPALFVSEKYLARPFLEP